MFFLISADTPIAVIYAQSTEYAIKKLSLEDGLSQSTTYSIIQDNQGFMWFTTEKGMDRMDTTTNNSNSELSIADKVINDLLEMTRLKEVHKEYTDLRVLIEQSVSGCNLNGTVNVDIDIPAESQFIWTNPLQLGQVFVNLIMNAYQAMDGQGAISFRVGQIDNGFLIKVQLPLFYFL